LVCGLLLLFTAGENNDREVQVCNELDQLRNDNAESLEQSLVRRGEMTPFGSVMTGSIKVNMCIMLVSGDDNNTGVIMLLLLQLLLLLLMMVVVNFCYALTYS